MKHIIDRKTADAAKKGFTLIEVLAAIVIFSILIALVMNVVAGSLVISKNTEIATRNVVLCSGKMDEIKAKILGRSTDVAYSFGWGVDYTAAATAFPAPDTGFKFTVSDPDFPAALIRDIAVTVWYDEDNDSVMDANEKGFTFNTKVAKRD
ncbi:MAG TPA: type II secretion system protein [Nitrospirae bacterium]|nr:type II secretion system protein [Nitrospirota bacterium]